MPKGCLEVFSSGYVKGEASYTCSLSPLRLGGLSNPRFQRVFLDLGVPRTPRQALLELAVMAPSSKVKWKLWFDGFAVTREFKPQFVVETPEGGVFAKLVFDVTPVIRVGEERHVVTVQYDGSSSLVVDHVGLLAVYDSDDAETAYSFLSGAMIIDPGEDARIKVPLTASGKGLMRIIGVLPSPQARVCVSVNGLSPQQLGGCIGADELLVEDLELSNNNEVVIKHLESEEQYYPRGFKLSSLLALVARYRTPKLEVVDVKYEEGKLRIKVRNSGETAPDKALIVALCLGSPLGRTDLEAVGPGEEVEVEIPVNVPRGEHLVTVRAIWRRGLRTEFIEKKVPFRVE